jgi:hypothetical protein
MCNQCFCLCFFMRTGSGSSGSWMSAVLGASRAGPVGVIAQDNKIRVAAQGGRPEGAEAQAPGPE